MDESTPLFFIMEVTVRRLELDEWSEIRGEIFRLYRKLGITNDDERHRIQHAVTGCSSLRYMTPEEQQKLVEALEHVAAQPEGEQDKMLAGLIALNRFRLLRSRQVKETYVRTQHHR